MTLSADGRESRALGQRVARSLIDTVGLGWQRPLIVALSGGPDSSALLLLLADTAARHGWAVRAAHIDHHIQTEAVRAPFRAACRDLAARIGVPLDIAHVDTPSASANTGDGLEATARRLRYDSLSELARSRGADVVATGHTLDDQAETVLLHLLRGSGLDGLSGIPPLRPLSEGVRLARPLLDLRRAETEFVCRAYGWQPISDPSNADDFFARNRIRRRLMPQLRSFNPRADESLARLARAVSADREYLDSVTDAAWTHLLDSGGALKRGALLAQPLAIRRRALRRWCAEQRIELSAERMAAALAAIERGHGCVQLPSEAELCVRQGTINLRGGCPPSGLSG